MREKSAGKGLGNMHEFMNQSLNLLSFRQSIKHLGIHLDDVVGLKSGNFGEELGHAPDASICAGLGVKTPYAVDVSRFHIAEIQLLNESIDNTFNFRSKLISHMSNVRTQNHNSNPLN